MSTPINYSSNRRLAAIVEDVTKVPYGARSSKFYLSGFTCLLPSPDPEESLAKCIAAHPAAC